VNIITWFFINICICTSICTYKKDIKEKISFAFSYKKLIGMKTSLADGMWKNMKKRVERKLISTFVLVLLVAASLVTSFVSFTKDMPMPYIVKAGNTWEDCSNNASAHHNATWLNVTIESKYPRILWYDIQKFTGAKENNDTTFPDSTDSNWMSIRNNMTEIDNATWLRVVINISSDQGWENIDYINISGWHDNGTLESGTDYNNSDNQGSNRNFMLSYENRTSNANYTIFWPRNKTELTKGDYTERVVTDNLGISGSTETHNLTFQFKPGYQFRYAPGPDGIGDSWINYSVINTEGFPSTNKSGIIDYETSSWEALNNSWSWNLNISVSNKGMRGGEAGGTYANDNYTSWVLDEFGVYSYTEIVSAASASIMGAPGDNASTASSNPFHSSSHNVSLKTRSNGNYSLLVNLSDLRHSAYDLVTDPQVKENLTLDNDNIWVRGGTRTTPMNFSDSDVIYINLYGTLSEYTSGASAINTYEIAEVNGTCKLTGEISDSGDDTGPRFPNYYSTYLEYDSQNENSTYIEFTCDIPTGQWAGKYSTNVYYTLITETIN